ncbi:MAG: cupin domain-containing protein [Sterolibacteriaceae bacterium]|uniref:Cupin domain-containing protein n=1 Tax=Candidatus Methylophosphatis roskildensis TaxID=2899263 RepID=A0A9D7DXY7_9PROT|nr:cupin domain-containing protein [Candidatus Methylophosphatis roskildensis]
MSKTVLPSDLDDSRNVESVESALAEALTPISPDGLRTSALRARLMQRARASRAGEEQFVNVRRDEGEWRPLAKGVRAKMLCEGKRAHSVLVELDAGAALPTHRHHEHEECVVLRGEARLGELQVRQGDYHLAPAGSRHSRVSSATGALLYLRGTSIGSSVGVARDLITAWLPGAGASPITVRADEGEWREFAPGAQIKSLWRDADAQSMLLRLQPGARADAHAHSTDEECLMLDGEAFLGDTLLRAGDYQLAPAGSRHREVASDVGALLFVHGGSAQCAIR